MAVKQYCKAATQTPIAVPQTLLAHTASISHSNPLSSLVEGYISCPFFDQTYAERHAGSRALCQWRRSQCCHIVAHIPSGYAKELDMRIALKHGSAVRDCQAEAHKKQG
jgi:hypothetical protein